MVRLLALLFLLSSFSLAAQQKKGPKFSASGYMKNLQTWLFFSEDFASDRFVQDNLLHNRINTTLKFNKRWKLRADLRTRAFFGDVVKADSTFADQVDDINNDYADLSLILLDQNAWVIHTMLDRLYLEYSYRDWEIRLGRQRVNWGISTVWNPNDIFNAFAFTDFDYEERPGSDVLRIKRYLGFASSVEVVAKAADHIQEGVFAAMWKFNKWNYDVQLFSAYTQHQMAYGLGWAGNLGTAGLKGETTFFQALESEQNNSFALTLGIDYAFKKGLYLAGGYLYNSNGAVNSNILELFTFQLSAQNLYPYRHALFLSATQPITPLWNGGLSLIYSPVPDHPVFFNPTLSRSLATNWDLDLVGQIVASRIGGKYVSPLQAVFLRWKVSF